MRHLTASHSAAFVPNCCGDCTMCAEQPSQHPPPLLHRPLPTHRLRDQGRGLAGGAMPSSRLMVSSLEGLRLSEVGGLQGAYRALLQGEAAAAY